MRKFIIISLLFLFSCVNNLETIGYKIDDIEIKKLQKGRYSKEDIIAAIGSPTINSDLSPNSWFYIFYIRNRVGFHYPEIDDIQILQLDFNKNNQLASLKEFTKDDLNRIQAEKSFTETKGTTLNPLYHILQNIQKHSIPVPSQIKKPKI
jgi:outer membrane protein assembly factor BamE (lipoprotein component of BamABCDE complex)